LYNYGTMYLNGRLDHNKNVYNYGAVIVGSSVQDNVQGSGDFIAYGTPPVEREYTVEVIFHANGGAFTGGRITDVRYPKLGEPLTNTPLVPIPEREGYTFDDWYTDAEEGAKWDMDAPVSNNMTLYAQWTAIDYYVTYDANGGTDAPEDSDNPYNIGDEVTVLYGIPTRPGYTFEGWLYDGDTYEDGDTFDMPADDVVLVAQWEIDPDQTYTITYVSNGNGSVDPTSETHQILYSALTVGRERRQSLGTGSRTGRATRQAWSW